MGPKPKKLILNLLMAADGTLSSREAVLACGLFGITENSVRVTLARLSTERLIEGCGRGQYRLGPAASNLADDLSGWRKAETRLGDWDGAWVAVYIGMLGRTDRSALKKRERVLQLAGFKELETGLLIRPNNLAGGVDVVRERLHRLGLEREAVVFLLDELDSVRANSALKLWDTRGLNRDYVKTRKELESWMKRADKLEPEEAARESFIIGGEAIRRMVFDPLLPAEMVDVEARHAFFETLLRYDEAGRDIWLRLYRSVSAQLER